jgi:hypothetical protein
MKKLSPETMMENLNKFYSLIDKYIEGNRKDALKKFYESNSATLTMSPSSCRVDHPNCFAGGYLDHVLRVVENALILDKVWDRQGQAKDYTISELVFSAINHDLGKLGTNEEPFYIQNDQQWQIEKQGIYYKYNPKIPHMRIADRSLFYLQKAGIPVSENEFLAIKLHDGLYEDGNKAYYVTFNSEYAIKSNLPYIIHQADIIATRVEKTQNN